MKKSDLQSTSMVDYLKDFFVVIILIFFIFPFLFPFFIHEFGNHIKRKQNFNSHLKKLFDQSLPLGTRIDSALSLGYFPEAFDDLVKFIKEETSETQLIDYCVISICRLLVFNKKRIPNEKVFSIPDRFKAKIALGVKDLEK